MIATITGILKVKTPNTVIIECGGIGYELLAPLTVTEQLPQVGEEVSLLTEFVVREESQTLYGFLIERERQLFRRLIKVNGVGAKTALAMMSAMTPGELLEALSSEDVVRLSRAPGVGKKTADRMIVDFRGSPLLVEAAATPTVDSEVEQVLAALGYGKAEIKKALSALTAADGDDTAARVRRALQILSGRSVAQ